jgi:hypothetical protein
MKLGSLLVISGIYGLLSFSALCMQTAFAADSSVEPPASVPPRQKAAASVAPSPEKLSPALAESKALEEAMRIHIRPARVQLPMATPPPPLLSETKPPTPSGSWVWVPGHWAPVNGEWQWRAGEWGAPATPISVWIESKYDEKTKIWTAGYLTIRRLQKKRRRPRKSFSETMNNPPVAGAVSGTGSSAGANARHLAAQS